MLRPFSDWRPGGFSFLVSDPFAATPPRAMDVIRAKQNRIATLNDDYTRAGLSLCEEVGENGTARQKAIIDAFEKQVGEDYPQWERPLYIVLFFTEFGPSHKLYRRPVAG